MLVWLAAENNLGLFLVLWTLDPHMIEGGNISQQRDPSREGRGRHMAFNKLGQYLMYIQTCGRKETGIFNTAPQW